MAGSARPLKGRSALVTGATRGIGRECARALGAAGARLLVARDARALGRVRRELAGAGTYPCDLSRPEAVAKLVDDVRDELGGVPDILVNNAGAFALAAVEETSLTDFDVALRLNLAAPFALVRAFVGDMRARGRGDVVTIGSIADHHAFPGNAAYAASKFGARGLHEVLREELRGSGVRATLVSPGPVDTALWDEVDPDSRPGFTPRKKMLGAAAVGDAVLWVVTRPPDVNIDLLRLSRA